MDSSSTAQHLFTLDRFGKQHKSANKYTDQILQLNDRFISEPRDAFRVATSPAYHSDCLRSLFLPLLKWFDVLWQ